MPRRVLFAALFAVVACRGLPSRPEAETPVVVLVSASAEWRAVKARFPLVSVSPSPYGEWFRSPAAPSQVTFFHGGYGKVAAAGSTQFAIDHFHPRLLVNLGTCGGFEGEAAVGDVVVASGTVIYDIVELMGDSSDAIAGFSTTLPDLWPARLDGKVRRAVLLSADRDLDPAQLGALKSRFGGVAGDWESGAIAFVAAHNRVPLLIARGVSDVVSSGGDVTYGDPAAFEVAAQRTMDALLTLFDDALPELLLASASPPTLLAP